jgi:tetratricopeptide (TPR) repeat protein
VVVALGLTVVACGSSTPRQAEVQAPAAVVAPSVARTPAPEAPQQERRRDRRSERSAAEAVAAADAVIPEAAAAAYGRALAAMRGEDWLSAELELEQLTQAFPAYAGPYVNLALVYLHDDRRDDARAALDRALDIDPGHAAANNQLGILLREQGKFAEAEEAYRRALETDPAHALAHYNLGVLLDVYLRRPAEALEHYEVYQSSLAAPDETVGRWIIDLRRRAGNTDAARVAREGQQ